LSDFILRARHRMAVNIGGNAGLGMTGAPLRGVEWCAHFKKEGDGCAPQVVEAGGRQFHFLEQSRKVLVDPCRVKKCAG